MQIVNDVQEKVLPGNDGAKPNFIDEHEGVDPSQLTEEQQLQSANAAFRKIGFESILRQIQTEGRFLNELSFDKFKNDIAIIFGEEDESNQNLIIKIYDLLLMNKIHNFEPLFFNNKAFWYNFFVCFKDLSLNQK